MKRITVALCVTLSLVSNFAIAAKTLVYCSEGSPNSFNPQLVPDGTSMNTSLQVFNQLVQFKLGETILEPGLASSWEISADGKQYTFHLRNDVSFHKTKTFTPTRKLNADDIIFSVDRQRLKDHPFHRLGGGVYEYWDSMGMTDLIEKIEKIDAQTVRFSLKHPEAPFLADMAMPFMAIQSKEYADQVLKAGGSLEKFDWEPVGTGPYVFVRYDKDQTIRYIANPDYFRGRPKLDNLIFSITPDASVRFGKLKTGECDVVTEPGFADLPLMAKNPKMSLEERPALNVSYLVLNVKKKPLDNVLVRRAINHAMNKKAYIDAIFLGRAELNPNPLPLAQWGFNSQITDFEYNPAKAKELLKQAGHPNGFEIELWTLPVSRPYNPNGKRMGEMMQADLAKVGIRAKLVTFDWPTYVAKQRSGEQVMMQIGWNSDNADPDNFLYGTLSCAAVKGGANQAQWCNKAYDKLVEKAKRISSQEERRKLYEEAQVIFHKDIPWVVIGTSKMYRAFSKRVINFHMTAFGLDPFESVDISAK
jgi:dipeptide transport system substrate-binding protein